MGLSSGQLTFLVLNFNFAHEFIVQLHPAWDGEPQEAVLQSHNYFQVVNIWRLRTKYIASTKDCQLQCMGTIEFLHYVIGVLCRGDSSQVRRSGISWNRRRALVIFQYFETSGWRRTRTWGKWKLTVLSIDVQAATPYQPPHGCRNAGVWQVLFWYQVVSVESSFSPKDCAGLMDE